LLDISCGKKLSTHIVRGRTGSDPLATIVNTDFGGATIVGIGYFTTNSFFIDLSVGTEGWK